MESIDDKALHDRESREQNENKDDQANSQIQKEILSHKYKNQSEFCKLFGHEKRLQILQLLRHGPRQAGELCEMLQISPANLSQHVSLLKRSGAILDTRKGNNIFYEVTDQKILEAMDIMEKVLRDIVSEKSNQFND